MLDKGIGCLNHQNLGGMDLTTRQRPVPCDGKNGRMAKSIFSIRSLMDVAEDSDGVEFRSRRFDGKKITCADVEMKIIKNNFLFFFC